MPHAHEPDYIAAQAVGRALGEAGFCVMTGGYAGVMEAASRGAAEANAHVIGVTTVQLELIRNQGCNQWVKDEIKYPTLRERLLHLITEADGYVVMPGGVGTLNELITVWELMRVGDIRARPLICYGAYWQHTLAELKKSPYVPPHYWNLIEFADRPEEAVAKLNAHLNEEDRNNG
jgi:uncharacterized protein (TIGR00730 family)